MFLFSLVLFKGLEICCIVVVVVVLLTDQLADLRAQEDSQGTLEDQMDNEVF